jgi:kanamycin kinase
MIVRVIAGPPEGVLVIPDAVVLLAGNSRPHAVWRNELGGVTFEIDGAAGHRFVKWAPAGSGIDLSAEAERLRWASSYAPVPRVLSHGADVSGQWLVTAALPGTSPIAARWKADPHTAVVGLGRGLRALHEALPVPSCPFDWSAERRIADATRRASLGRLRPTDWHPEHAALTVEQALRRIGDPPPPDQLVVCHGDACAPNTLLDDDGRPCGHVDLGALGLADRWADLAVATWSTEWNYGPGWTDVLIEAYGVNRDQPRIDYYRLLQDLGP